ncbi:hypothetical protein LVW35_00240 [Pseudomonas sp. HN11]|uniref:hypothetical protein n=1 Tax=Pseudomonas sp. HN11 TaxID=1344094 RepID=UPI001F347A3D|nr:hypothetical protein [Pseudomonas sp. HN11]UII71643.1 hypothetical protein LVW35_00240 [Pseudomonas sp. HN11]
MTVVRESKNYVPLLMPGPDSNTPKSEGVPEQRFVQPLTPKSRMTAEETKAKDTFRKQVLIHHEHANSAGPSRRKRDASVYHQKTPIGQALEKEATEIKKAQTEWEKKYGNIPGDPSMTTAQHISDFDAVFDRYEGDALLAHETSKTMKAQTGDDLRGPSPQVVVPGKSTIYPFKLQVSAAFTNRILRDWTVDNKIDSASLRYDTSTNVFHAKTLDGKDLSYTPSEFASNFPSYKEALDPIVEIAKVVAPKGGVQLQKYPEGSASLDLILSFYGLDPSEKSLDKYHEIANKLKEEGEFPSAAQQKLPVVADVAKYRAAMEQKERAYVSTLAPEVESRPDFDFETFDAESTIAKATGNVMAKMDQADLYESTPLIDIPQQSKLFPWLQQINAAFDNKILTAWAENYDADLNTLNYSSSLKMFSVRTINGETLTFTAEEFDKLYPKYSGGLAPITDVANVVAPEGGVRLKKYPDNKAGLDLVQSFYGLDPTERNIAKINEMGRKLATEQEFDRQPEIKERSPQALAEQQQALQTKEAKYAENLNKPVGTYPPTPKEMREMAETKVAIAAADKMGSLTEADKSGQDINIEVPPETKLHPWLQSINSAFKTGTLLVWAEEYKMDPASFRYDTTTGKFHASTLDGGSFEYTPEEFSEKFPRFNQSLTPIVEVAKVVAPKGGVILKQSPEGIAPLDLVLGFYGVNLKEQALEKTHEMAEAIKHGKAFPVPSDLPDRGKEALKKQSQIQDHAEEFSNWGNNTHIAIESDGRGGGVKVPGKI